MSYEEGLARAQRDELIRALRRIKPRKPLTREQSKRVKSYIDDSGMTRAEAVAMVRFEDWQ